MKISVIVPAYNASNTLARCLEAICAQKDQETEILVVDDCSIDDSRKMAEAAGAQVFQTSKRGGPAAARNLGAQRASGEILFFIDSDVVIAPGSIELVRNTFLLNPQVSAVFGSYDDAPAESNFLSQYKNLMHHFVHHESNSNAGTFWAGCGAIRAKIFSAIGGFDAELYARPSIEDIEMGIRLVEKNHQILLNPQLQGKHLKRWTIRSLLKADILDRAFPWSKLIAQRGVLPKELNLKIYQRMSGALTILFLLSVAGSLLLQSPALAIVALVILATLLILNRHVYLFFLRKKGILFLPGTIFWHLLYYFYSTMVFAYCWIRFRTFAAKSHSGTTQAAELRANSRP